MLYPFIRSVSCVKRIGDYPLKFRPILTRFRQARHPLAQALQYSNISLQAPDGKMILSWKTLLLILALAEAVLGTIPNYTEHIFTQVVDHFGIGNTDTFQQRYFVTGTSISTSLYSLCVS